MKLTKQQETFCIEIAKGNSQIDSFHKAYPHSKKWSNNAVSVDASRLVKKPNIRLRIDEIKSKMSKVAEEKALIEVKDIIELHANIIKSDIKDYLSFGMVDKVAAKDINGNPIIIKDLGVNIKDSDQVDGRLIKKVTLSNTGGFSFELYDKQDSLKEMARIMGLYDDKSKILFPEPLQINVASELDTEQLEDLLKILDRKK